MPKSIKYSYSLNKYFAQLRLNSPYTQSKISEETGIPYRTYQRIEQNQTIIDADHIERLCRFYNVTLLDVARHELKLRGLTDQETFILLNDLPPHIKAPITELLKALSCE